MEDRLTTHLWTVSGATWLVLEGELDLATVMRHGDGLRAEGDVDALVIDARKLEFVDLAGARLLSDMIEHVSRRGGEASIASCPLLHRLAKAAALPSLLLAEQEAEALLALDRESPAPDGSPDAPTPARTPSPTRSSPGAVAAGLRALVADECARNHMLLLRATYLGERVREAAGRSRAVIGAAVEAKERRRASASTRARHA